ncbi:MAG: cyclic nucleotide-binding domain-containing protein [Candidatus Nitronauta litoralis]|uniref:Cyclic nucleotide-binding domain-containing protein n=1 Tax=Candidatus Nitronauta litoralis TaxID=2705533 RepID=A0A7T0BTS4_9BACT|nr:MAG: cyclic nucleotide-binding domain-containing protein [Candidatus Nitronauta litoralis]
MKFSDTPIVQRFSDGDVIISEGIVSNNVFIILEGKVNITKKSDKKNVLVAQLKEGDVFGEMGLISGKVRSANCTAVGNVTIGVIDKEKFAELIDNLPEDLQAVVRALVNRLRFTTEQLSRIGTELDKTRAVLSAFSIDIDT